MYRSLYFSLIATFVLGCGQEQRSSVYDNPPQKVTLQVSQWRDDLLQNRKLKLTPEVVGSAEYELFMDWNPTEADFSVHLYHLRSEETIQFSTLNSYPEGPLRTQAQIALEWGHLHTLEIRRQNDTVPVDPFTLKGIEEGRAREMLLGVLVIDLRDPTP